MCNDVDELLRYLEDKKKHLQAIAEISIKQGETIKSGDIDGLSKYIEKRQQHIAHIDKLDDRFSTCLGDLGECREKSDEYKEVYKVLLDIREIITGVYAKDQENKECLNVLIEKHKGKMRKINNGQKTYNAYKPSAPIQDGIFIDQKQ